MSEQSTDFEERHSSLVHWTNKRATRMYARFVCSQEAHGRLTTIRNPNTSTMDDENKGGEDTANGGDDANTDENNGGDKKDDE